MKTGAGVVVGPVPALFFAAAQLDVADDLARHGDEKNDHGHDVYHGWFGNVSTSPGIIVAAR